MYYDYGVTQCQIPNENLHEQSHHVAARNSHNQCEGPRKKLYYVKDMQRDHDDVSSFLDFPDFCTTDIYLNFSINNNEDNYLVS